MSCLVFKSPCSMAKLGVVVVSSGLLATNAMAKGLLLASVLVPKAATVDGISEQQWQLAQPLTLALKELPYKPNNGYDGIKETEVEIRSLYDGESIYFLYRWDDPTHSLARFPWQKNKDGSWQQLSNKDSTHHENTYYEDKFAVQWNISQRGFVKKGCDKSCHMVEDGLIDGVKDSSSGRHYTKSANETLDEWQWKAARTNPVGQLTDGFVDNEHQTNKKWGRHGDEYSAGGYHNNTNKTNNTSKTAVPAWINGLTKAAAPYWVMDNAKLPFEDNFKAGDRIGGIVTSKVDGSRGDVSAVGVWKDGYWQLEVKRKLVTSHQQSATQDIQFDDLSKPYYFGVTVFDNSQINHLYHKKSIKLTFNQ